MRQNADLEAKQTLEAEVKALKESLVTQGDEERLASIEVIEKLKAKNDKLKERSDQAKASFKEVIENLESQITQLNEQFDHEKLEKEALQNKDET